MEDPNRSVIEWGMKIRSCFKCGIERICICELDTHNWYCSKCYSEKNPC